MGNGGGKRWGGGRCGSHSEEGLSSLFATGLAPFHARSAADAPVDHLTNGLLRYVRMVAKCLRNGGPASREAPSPFASQASSRHSTHCTQKSVGLGAFGASGVRPRRDPESKRLGKLCGPRSIVEFQQLDSTSPRCRALLRQAHKRRPWCLRQLERTTCSVVFRGP